MFEINTMTTFLGWCSIINSAILIFSTISLVLARESIIRIHSKLLGVKPDALPMLYFQYLGFFKIAIIMLNIVPYFALKLMH